MHRNMMQILACPVDKETLVLTIEREEGDVVLSGTLTCSVCGQQYPIVESVPKLVPAALAREP